MLNLDEKIGPFPLWGWGIALIGGVAFFMHTQRKQPLSNSIDTSYETVATLPPPNLSGYGVGSTGGAYDYAPASVFPTAVPNVSPTPGSQGGSWQPGLTPAVSPIAILGGLLTDPTTGRPVYTGPNGEGGTAWSPGTAIPTGYMTYQMPDGRWSAYMPNTYIQNGNRVALGLAPVDYADSSAPGANPASVQQLLGMAS